MNRTLSILAVLALAVSASAQNFSGTLAVSPAWKATQTNGAALSTIELGTILSQAHTYGTNAFQMNAIALRSGTLTNGQTLDVSLAAMTNGFGPVAFARVNFLAVRSPTNNAMVGTNMVGTNALVVGNAASDQFAAWLGGTNQAVAIRPGGLLLLTAPISGYAATNKILRLANVGDTNAVAFDLYVGGVAELSLRPFSTRACHG